MNFQYLITIWRYLILLIKYLEVGMMNPMWFSTPTNFSSSLLGMFLLSKTLFIIFIHSTFFTSLIYILKVLMLIIQPRMFLVYSREASARNFFKDMLSFLWISSLSKFGRKQDIIETSMAIFILSRLLGESIPMAIISSV